MATDQIFVILLVNIKLTDGFGPTPRPKIFDTSTYYDTLPVLPYLTPSHPQAVSTERRQSNARSANERDFHHDSTRTDARTNRYSAVPALTDFHRATVLIISTPIIKILFLRPTQVWLSVFHYVQDFSRNINMGENLNYYYHGVMPLAFFGVSYCHSCHMDIFTR